MGVSPAPRHGVEAAGRRAHVELIRFHVADGSVRIGHDGRLSSSLKSFRGGWRDGELYVRFAAAATGSYTLQLGGTTKTLQFWEPLVQKPLLGRGDQPYDGLGDSFGRPG